MRAGHTEASRRSRAARRALPAAVICEIMNDDGTMARMPDLVPFAKQHGLKIGTIEDLIAYRLKNDRIVTPRRQDAQSRRASAASSISTSTRRPSSRPSIWRWSRARSRSRGPVLVRVQPSTSSTTCSASGGEGETRSVIDSRMRAIEKEGRGVLVLIRDLRPKSLSEWVARTQRRRRGQGRCSKERRQVEIGIGSQILADLGVTDMVLLTTSPAHVYVGSKPSGCASPARGRSS